MKNKIVEIVQNRIYELQVLITEYEVEIEILKKKDAKKFKERIEDLELSVEISRKKIDALYVRLKQLSFGKNVIED